jgi:DNA polymerase III sliding clamp (beta) subunit (PCNA family)
MNINIKVHASDLILVMDKIDKVASVQRSALNGTGYARIEAKDNKVHLTTVNNIMISTFEIPAEINQSGHCWISIEKLTRFVNYEVGDITINAKGNLVALTRDNVVQTMKQGNVEWRESLEIPKIRYKTGPDFISKIAIALPYSAGEESRPILSGLLFKTRDHVTDICGADGFRMAVVKTNTELPDGSFVIPRKALQSIVSIFGDKYISIALSDAGTSHGKIFFIGNGTVISTHSILGTFPDYEALIPGAASWQFTLSCSYLSEKLKQANINERHIIRLLSKNGKLALQANDSDNDSCGIEVAIPVSSMTGDGKIGMNIQYLQQAVETFQEITVGVNEPSNPCVIAGNIKDATMVIMPVFVQW